VALGRFETGSIDTNDEFKAVYVGYGELERANAVPGRSRFILVDMAAHA
jgi:hypothetical protein